MQLNPLSRALVRASRRLMRWAVRTPSARRLLLTRRKADLARGLDPETAIVLELGALVGETSLVGGKPDVERRKMMEHVSIVDDRPAGSVRVTDHSVTGAAGSLPARLYEPVDLARPSAGLVYVHGGGFVTGDLDTHDTLCRRLALVGKIRVVAIAPRLAPEHPFPAPADDTLAAFRHVAMHAADFGIDPACLGIGGDSAGGNLSAVVGLETRTDSIRPALTALLYPALDATWSQPSIDRLGTGFLLTRKSLDWYIGHYIQGNDALRTDPRVSPLLAADIAGAARALVVVAAFDPLIDEAVAYAKRLTEAGTTAEVLRYDAFIHGFMLMTGISPAARAATEDIADRIGQILRGAATVSAEAV